MVALLAAALGTYLYLRRRQKQALDKADAGAEGLDPYLGRVVQGPHAFSPSPPPKSAFAGPVMSNSSHTPDNSQLAATRQQSPPPQSTGRDNLTYSLPIETIYPSPPSSTETDGVVLTTSALQLTTSDEQYRRGDAWVSHDVLTDTPNSPPPAYGRRSLVSEVASRQYTLEPDHLPLRRSP